MVVKPPRLMLALALLMAACSGAGRPPSASIPPEALPVGTEVLATRELAAVADLQPGDGLFRLPVGQDSVLVRVRAGEPTLLFGTSCDVVSASLLPDGWEGVCLEYTSDGQRNLGTFPHGTTSR